MPISMLNAYLDHLETRRIETKMMLSDVAMLSVMKPKVRNELLGKWMKKLEIQEPRKMQPASPARMRMMGIGVKYVSK